MGEIVSIDNETMSGRVDTYILFCWMNGSVGCSVRYDAVVDVSAAEILTRSHVQYCNCAVTSDKLNIWLYNWVISLS